MKAMLANRASKRQFSVATAFALLRERHLEIDTIPKPRGLGSGGQLNGPTVQLLSGIGPASVQVLSSFCPASVRGPEYRWKTNFATF